MPTTITKTVKSSGGNYSSLSAWEAGEQGNLTTLDQIKIAECYAFNDTVALTVAGWTTDGTRYATATVPISERHNGQYDASKYMLTNAATVTISSQFTMVGIQFIRGAQSVNCITVTGSGIGVNLTQCIVSGCDRVIYLSVAASNEYCNFISSLAFNCNRGIMNNGAYWQVICRGSTIITNDINTGACINCDRVGANGAPIIYNSYFSSPTTCLIHTGGATKASCATSDATGTAGLLNIPLASAGFVNTGANNYNLIHTSPLVGTGVVDDGATVDLAGNTRPTHGTEYDVGALGLVITPIVDQDFPSVSLGDTGAVNSSASLAESIAVALAETAGIGTALSNSDTLNITLAETSPLSIKLSSTEQLDVQLADIGTVRAYEYAGDQLDVFLFDTPTVTGISFGTVDTLNVAINETATFNANIPQSDGIAVALSETVPTMLVSFGQSDGIAVALTETTANFSTDSATDQLDMRIDESSSLGGNAMLSASDTMSPVVVESTSITGSAAWVGTDTLAVAIDELSFVFGSATLLDADTLAVAIAESALAVPAIMLLPDTLAVSIDESSLTRVNLSNIDAVASALFETTDTTKPIASNDQLNIVLGENLPAQGALFVVAHDGAAIVIDEAALGWQINASVDLIIADVEILL